MTSDFQIKENRAFEAAMEKYVTLTSVISSLPASVGMNDAVQVIKGLYDAFDNKEYSFTKKRKFVEVIGRIYSDGDMERTGEPYTSSIRISQGCSNKELLTLVEDMTMASYKLAGGTRYTYTPFLISSLEASSGLCR